MVNLDTNWAQGKSKRTNPMIVLPDDATPKEKAAARKYLDKMEKAIKKGSGRNVKGEILYRTREDGEIRGRAGTIHTEPFAVNDTELAKYFSV